MCQNLIPINNFQRCASNNPIIAKVGKGNNSINTGDRVMVLACLLHFPPLPSISISSFICLSSIHLEIYSNLLLQKLGREITVITSDRVLILAVCTSSDKILSMYQVLFITCYSFQDILRTN